ncbi:hypothetical protein JL721_4887 [Aureococcus anophagefferens]|nr:hypothetical protein JL721_4887 [Aureococcus anophagefferens]
MDASMLPPPPPTVLEASAGVFDMADAPPAAAAASAAPRDPLGPQNGPAIIGNWTLPAPPPKKAAPPPPPPPPPAAPAPIALYRVDVADHASVAAALAPRAAKGRSASPPCSAGGAYDEAVAVPAGVTPAARARTPPPRCGASGSTATARRARG